MLSNTFRLISVLMFVGVNTQVFPMSLSAETDICPGLESNIETQLGPAFVNLLQEIKGYLEAGKPPAGIPAKFRYRPDDAPLDEYSTDIVITDLAGKGNQDIVVTIRRGLPMVFGQSGAFVFQKCSDGQYTIHYISTNPDSYDLMDYQWAEVIPVRLLPDRSSQLLVTYSSVRSGRCRDEVYIVVGQVQDRWMTYLNDEVGCGSRDVTMITQILARDPDATGRKGLRFGGDRWTGWGVYQFAVRPVRIYYSWQGDQLQFEKRVYKDSAYRFHILEDAQMALDAGDLKSALQYYQRAATLGYLKDSVSWYEFDSLRVDLDDPASRASAEKIAHQYQTAFAYFRALVISADIQRPNQLRQLVEQIARLYPPNTWGHEFADLATTFQDEFRSIGDRSAACRRVNALVESKFPSLTGADGHVGNWGDEGAFTIDVICPQ